MSMLANSFANASSAPTAGKARRRRQNLSCVACMSRKIKCDRNVPQCNSCVLRGIQGQCRWGDERDNEPGGAFDPHRQAYAQSAEASQARIAPQSEPESRKTAQKKDRKRSRSSREEVGSGDVMDAIVDAVLSRLKRKRKSGSARQEDDESESEDDTESSGSDGGVEPHSADGGPNSIRLSDESDLQQRDVVRKAASKQARRHAPPSLDNGERESPPKQSWESLLRYNARPPPNSVARRVPMTAFEGVSDSFFFSVTGDENLENKYYDREFIASSLRFLPKRAAFQTLLDLYMRELEPTKQYFNRVIFAKQLAEFWKDIDDLGIETGSRMPSLDDGEDDAPPSHPTGNLALLNGIGDHGKIPLHTEGKKHPLCAIPRQGFICLLFCLIEQVSRIVEPSTLVELGIMPRGATQQTVYKWAQTANSYAKLHFSLSDFISRPTLWTLQATMMSEVISSGIPEVRAKHMMQSFPLFGTTSLALFIAVSLGLNRLGSAYDDVQESASFFEHRVAPSDRHLIDTLNDTQANASGEPRTVSTQTQKGVIATIRLGTWMADFESNNLAYRELGRKLWTVLVSMDSMISTHTNQFHCVHDDIDHTAPPMALDDVDICSQHAAIYIAQARPDGVVPKMNTYCAYMLAMGKVARMQVQLENRKGAPLPYSDLLYLDRRFTAVFEALPPYLSLHTQDADAVVYANETQENAIALQRCILNDQAYFRVLRLHRLYLGRGFKDRRFRRSTIACVESANGILHARTQMEQAGRSIRSSLFLQSHLVHAALVFQLVLLHQMDRARIIALRGGSDGTSDHHRRRPQATAGGAVADGEDEMSEVEDFDAVLSKLQTCLDYLRPGAQHARTKEFVPGLDSFVAGMKAHRAQALLSKPSARGKTQPSKRSRPAQADVGAHADAATILASMPTPMAAPAQASSFSPLSGGGSNTTPASYDSTSFDQHFGPPQSHSSWLANTPASSSSSSWRQGSISDAPNVPVPFNALDPSVWSLEAMFPNYAEGIDLMAALEDEVMAAEQSTAGSGAHSIFNSLSVDGRGGNVAGLGFSSAGTGDFVAQSYFRPG